uniref:Putative Spermidine/putrescine-binding periplasmic protein n=1 Tax=mine drainage metagenome TaxID=410659 RepID=E6PUK4_9ZZZZ
MKYLEPIQSNPEFFAKVAALLKSGEATGYDLAVMM